VPVVDKRKGLLDVTGIFNRLPKKEEEIFAGNLKQKERKKKTERGWGKRG